MKACARNFGFSTILSSRLCGENNCITRLRLIKLNHFRFLNIHPNKAMMIDDNLVWKFKASLCSENYKRTPVKRAPAIKRTLSRVLKLTFYIFLYNEPLFSGHLLAFSPPSFFAFLASFFLSFSFSFFFLLLGIYISRLHFGWKSF